MKNNPPEPYGCCLGVSIFVIFFIVAMTWLEYNSPRNTEARVAEQYYSAHPYVKILAVHALSTNHHSWLTAIVEREDGARDQIDLCGKLPLVGETWTVIVRRNPMGTDPKVYLYSKQVEK